MGWSNVNGLWREWALERVDSILQLEHARLDLSDKVWQKGRPAKSWLKHRGQSVEAVSNADRKKGLAGWGRSAAFLATACWLALMHNLSLGSQAERSQLPSAAADAISWSRQKGEGNGDGVVFLTVSRFDENEAASGSDCHGWRAARIAGPCSRRDKRRVFASPRKRGTR